MTEAQRVWRITLVRDVDGSVEDDEVGSTTIPRIPRFLRKYTGSHYELREVAL